VSDCFVIIAESLTDIISLLLGYGERSSVYYIRCHECVEEFASDPAWAAVWEEEFQKIDAKMQALDL
jgi:SWI/SNF-related matrix-associated actin-dependent regulator of chromatin subfamily A member 5